MYLYYITYTIVSSHLSSSGQQWPEETSSWVTSLILHDGLLLALVAGTVCNSDGLTSEQFWAAMERIDHM